MFNKSIKVLMISLEQIKKNLFVIAFLIIQMITTVMVIVSFLQDLNIYLDKRKIASVLDNIENTYYFYTSSEEYISDTVDKMKSIDKNIVKDVGRAGQATLFSKDDGYYDTIEYSDYILYNMQVGMKEGKWFEKDKDYDGYIPAVIVIDSGVSVGDVLTLGINGDYNEQVRIKVIGAVDKNEYVMALGGGSTRASYDNCTWSTNECSASFIVPFEDLENYRKEVAKNHSMKLSQVAMDMLYNESSFLIKVNDNISRDRVKETYGNYGKVLSMEKLRENYINDYEYIFRFDISLALIFVVVTTIGIVGVYMLINYYNSKTYAIYVILGMSRIKCIMAEIIRLGIPFVIAYISSVYVIRNEMLIDIFSKFNIVKAENLDYRVKIGMVVYYCLVFLFVTMKRIVAITKENPIEMYRKCN